MCGRADALGCIWLKFACSVNRTRMVAELGLRARLPDFLSHPALSVTAMDMPVAGTFLQPPLANVGNGESMQNCLNVLTAIEKKIALRIECWISILKQSKRKPLLCIKRKGGQRPYAYMPTHIWRREKVIKLWREIEKKSRSFIFLRLQSLDITLVTVTNIGDW